MKEFKNGDIVTYDSCPTTIAIYRELNPKPNDSGDITYKCYVAAIGDSLYLGNLVISDDIRLANENEKTQLYELINKNIWEYKRKIYDLKYKGNNYDGPGKEG